MTGFKGRTGRSFRARLALMQNEEGHWRVEFDEPWAKEGFKEAQADEMEAAAAAAAAAGGRGARGERGDRRGVASPGRPRRRC